jgi:ketosteroid isomerase-like protein
MVATERAFSAMSVSTNMRDAFVAYLAPDGIVFRPLPVNGLSVWKPRTPSPATLIWEPSHAEVAAAGDMGWTTGPWEFRPPADSTGAPPAPDKIAHGHFTTIWARQPDGRWLAEVDMGVSHARPERGVGTGDLTPGPVHSWASGARKSAKARANLTAVDRLYAADVKKLGAAGALDVWGTRDLRLNLEEQFPSENRDAAKTMVTTTGDLVRILPQASRVSASDDLGYSYGVIERIASRSDAPDSTAYFHVWRKEADRRWRLASIVENPVKVRR